MNSENPSNIFPQGEKASPDYFTGNVWVKILVPNDSNLNCQVGNVQFEPGARTHWHTHPGGQILLVTEGTGYYREKGKAIQLLKEGDAVKILPDVVHWHGASPDSHFTHIAINPNAQQGIAVWLDKVKDEEYSSDK